MRASRIRPRRHDGAIGEGNRSLVRGFPCHTGKRRERIASALSSAGLICRKVVPLQHHRRILRGPTVAPGREDAFPASAGGRVSPSWLGNPLQPIRARARASVHFPRHVERARLVQGVEKSFCRLEIGGVKSFGEAVVDRPENCHRVDPGLGIGDQTAQNAILFGWMSEIRAMRIIETRYEACTQAQ
jgi:hypothetical protein